jgi:hypothetical protein
MDQHGGGKALLTSQLAVSYGGSALLEWSTGAPHGRTPMRRVAAKHELTR